MLLNIILAWNEAFWTIRLTTTNAAPLTAFIASLLEPAGPVLGEAVGGLDAGDRADPDHGLVQPEAAGARPDLRRGEVRIWGDTMGNIALETSTRSFGSTTIIPNDRPRHRGRRVRGLRRPVGLRQVHAAAADRRARGHHRRQDHASTAATSPARPGQARAGDGVPVLCALSAHDACARTSPSR